MEFINKKEKEKEKEKEKNKKFKRSTIVYNFIDFIVKKVYLINDPIGIETE